MTTQTSPVLDPTRLAYLRYTGLLDSPADLAFDRLSRLATEFLEAPVALVSLVEDDRQFFKSCTGLAEPWAARRQTPMSHSFCRHVVDSGQPLVIEDARDNPLVCANPAIADMDVIAYLGIPLVTPAGHVLGSFCVIDRVPRRWTDHEVETLRNLAGSVMTEIALRVDIAERRRAEQERDRFFHLAADLMAVIDLDGRLRRVNPAWEQTLGHPGTDLIGRSLLDLVHPEDRGAAAAELWRLAAGEPTLDFEARWLGRDGTPIWLSWAASPALDERSIYLIARDVGGRKRAEEQRVQLAREQAARAEAEVGERRHRLLAEAIPQLVWGAGPDGGTEFVNRRWTEYTGLSAARSRGEGWEEVVHPEDRPGLLARWREALAAGESFEAECRLRRAADGADRWHLVRALPLHDDRHRELRWFGTCTDIDDQKRAERASREAKEAAEAASRAKDTFLAIVSHELRTPLTPALFAATALLDRGGLEPEVRDLLAMVADNLAMEARLIDDLLDATRVVRGKMAYRFEEADVHELIKWAVEHCGAREAEGVELRLDLRAARPRVRGDVARLRQVLCNLLGNAVKFTPAGGRVTIATRDEGPRLLVSVRDTGIGIAAEALPRIFAAFEQGEGTAIRRYGGLGLGLTISRAIIEAHGGRLEARSAGPGAGSEFTLDLEAGG